MACCAPNKLGSGPEAADSCKRVNYTLGMLLGVDDFVQESTYHGARRRELAREVLGYGTVHGLQVVVERDGDRGPRLRVMPGMAWLPSGTPVCVDSAQCANLNDWLVAHATEVQRALVASPPRVSLFAVLSYAPCLTDNVPIPGEPCRSEDELMQPSRVADGFRLELRLARPPQREEDAIRDFVEWLVRLPLAPSSPPLGEAEFIDELRRAAREWLTPASPPTSPPTFPSDFMLGAAPAGTSEALFTAALRLWATELRPLWMARAACGCSAPPIPPYDDAVLLAELRVDLVSTGSGGGWRVSDVDPAVACDESRRPVLLSLRMVQELITRHPSPDPGDAVVPEATFGLAPAAGTSLAYSRADHTHGSPVLPELGGDLSGPIDAARIESLQGVPLVSGRRLADGQVLTFERGQWVPADPPTPAPILDGDVTGPSNDNEIKKLQSHEVAASRPGLNEVLQFNGTQWVPALLPGPPPLTLDGDVTGPAGRNVITHLQRVELDARATAPDQVLQFNGTRWAPALLSAPAGQFVGRGTPDPYEIVAAGEVLAQVLRSGVRLTMLPSPGYGDLTARSATFDPARLPQELEVNFTADVRDATRLKNYIVKLTPMWSRRMRLAFRVFLIEGIDIGDSSIGFSVLVLADQRIQEQEAEFRFQVEVSRFFSRF